MTKRERVRRYKNPNLPLEAFNNPVAAASSGVASTSAGSNTISPRKLNWQAEYGEVLGDLRKTAIIAVALIAVMIVLSFVIR